MRLRLLGLGVAVASGLGIGAAAADETGAGLYAEWCAACHGASGMGDGDMAGVMTIPAPNLTLLSQGNDGVFPMLDVIHSIDGRTGLRAHGGAMPLFGSVFSTSETENPYGSVLEARGRVLSLALYLESMQQ